MKNKSVAAILALLLGLFGIHKFYLKETGKGILYLLFCWTAIPCFLGIYDAIKLFTMSDNKFIEKYNADKYATNTDAIFFLEGIGSRLFVYENRLVLERHGLVGSTLTGFSGNKTIPITSVQSVEFKEGSSILNGYLRFSYPGSEEKRGGVYNATDDQNAIVFKKKQNSLAQEIKSYIENHMGNNSKTTIVNQSSNADEILKLKNLLDKGIITQEEFEQKKKDLLK